MSGDNQAKGDMFQAVLGEVARKWGRIGLETVGASPTDYRMERWYPFSEMCSVLSRVKTGLGNGNPLTVYQLGLGVMKDDPRWRDLFGGRDPGEIFLTMKRQGTQHRGGSQTMERQGPRHVRIILENWECDPVWYDFYRGRLQGILELTGRTGVVHLLPPDEGEPDRRVYDIKWG